MGALQYIQGVLAKQRGDLGMAFGGLFPSLALAHPEALRGKRVLVSGANSGIGFETALLFAKHGAQVVLLCRNLERGEKALRDVGERTGDASVELFVVDFSSLKSVRAFADQWRARPEDKTRVDVLVNNAGGPSDTKQTTGEGFEVSYVTNHLSHLVLSLSLLPCFPADGSGRIVNVSSQMQYSSDPLEPGPARSNSEDILARLAEGETVYGSTMLLLYARSKAMQTVGTVELQRRAKGQVIVNAVHPGVVRTNIWNLNTKLNPWFTEPIRAYVSVAGINADQSAVAIANLSTSGDPAVTEGGRFWDRGGYKWLPSWMLDEKRREALWDGWIVDAAAQDLASNLSGASQ